MSDTGRHSETMGTSPDRDSDTMSDGTGSPSGDTMSDGTGSPSGDTMSDGRMPGESDIMSDEDDSNEGRARE